MVHISNIVKPHLFALCLAMLFAMPAAADTAESLNADLVYHAFFGDGQRVTELIEQGANPHALNRDGVPAISLAATRKSNEGLDVIKALLASRADINQVDQNGQTALFYAARVGNLDAVKLLLEMGASYYQADKSGNIARNVAYGRGYMDVFNYMDAFVNQQRSDVLKEYDDRAKQINAAQKKLEANAKAAAEAQAALQIAQAQAKREAEEERVTTPKTKAPPEQRKLGEKDKAAFSEAVRELSKRTCLMQYWYYVKSARLKSELSSAQINETIDAHTQASQAQLAALTEFGARQRYIKKITEPSKDQIFEQLEAYGSNITRVSHGIGTADDAAMRCNQIADNWVITMPQAG